MRWLPARRRISPDRVSCIYDDQMLCAPSTASCRLSVSILCVGRVPSLPWRPARRLPVAVRPLCHIGAAPFPAQHPPTRRLLLNVRKVHDRRLRHPLHCSRLLSPLPTSPPPPVFVSHDFSFSPFSHRPLFLHLGFSYQATGVNRSCRRKIEQSQGGLTRHCGAKGTGGNPVVVYSHLTLLCARAKGRKGNGGGAGPSL